MIDRKSLMFWGENAPWSEPYMIEQDLIICKALVCIFSDEFLSSQLAIQSGLLDVDRVLESYRRYMEFVVEKIPTYKQYVQNMELKMQAPSFWAIRISC